MREHDHPTFDLHQHDDDRLISAINGTVDHQHDNHPRHRHDVNGSIIYLDDWPAPVDDVAAAIGRFLAAPDLIGEYGYDITHRSR